MQETRVRSLGREGPPEKDMATHSSTLAWRTPWTEEPARLLQSVGSQRVGHDTTECLSTQATVHTTARLQSRPRHYSEEPLQGLHAIFKVQAPSCSWKALQGLPTRPLPSHWIACQFFQQVRFPPTTGPLHLQPCPFPAPCERPSHIHPQATFPGKPSGPAPSPPRHTLLPLSGNRYCQQLPVRLSG